MVTLPLLDLDRVSMINLIGDAMVDRLVATLMTPLAEDHPLRPGVIRRGKLQENPTQRSGINILVNQGNENFKHELWTNNKQAGLVSPTYTLGDGGSAFQMRRFRVVLTFFYKGEVDRDIAHDKTAILYSAIQYSLLTMRMPKHPLTLETKDDFGECALAVQIGEGFVREGGGKGTFIWKGEMDVEFLTEISTPNDEEL